MIAHPKIVVNILSGQLKPLARKWRIVLIISIIAFLILPYPLNRIFGNTTLFIVFFIIIVCVVLCSAAIYNHIQKFETIGRLIMDTNSIEIKTITDKKIIDVQTIKEIYFEPNEYRRLPYLTGFLKILSDNRNRNYLTIKTVNETYSFELYIEENSLLIKLKKHIENFGNFGIRTTIL